VCEGIQATEGIMSAHLVDVTEAHGEAEALQGSLPLSVSLSLFSHANAHRHVDVRLWTLL
jgi:hypothetical protein